MSYSINALLLVVTILVSQPFLMDISDDPNYIEVLKLIDKKEYNKAEEVLEQLLEEYPDNPYILHNLGLVRAGQADLKGASEYWRRAIKVDSRQKNSYLNLGIALIQMGEVEEAEGVLRTALAFFPMDAHLHYNLAVAIGYQGRYDEAIGEYEKVIELMPQHLQALYNLALLFQDTEPDRAVELWRRYLDLAREIPSEGRYVKEAEVYLQLAISKAVEGE
ncbi:MAG: hypothetical protein DRH49_05360 [Candidatus Coatesbacteria bacterium]|nr:MAG: hypothetical protein DRH49_05360 [Candidatus Coatesbacteria bacterium]